MSHFFHFFVEFFGIQNGVVAHHLLFLLPVCSLNFSYLSFVRKKWSGLSFSVKIWFSYDFLYFEFIWLGLPLAYSLLSRDDYYRLSSSKEQRWMDVFKGIKVLAFLIGCKLIGFQCKRKEEGGSAANYVPEKNIWDEVGCF